MSKEFLRSLPLFEKLAEMDLDRLYRLAQPMKVKKGDVLMREGEPGDSMFAVIDGEFEITKQSGKQDVLLGIRKAGDVVGEMSLLDEAPRLATVRALRDGEGLLISQAAFQQVLACSPSAVVSVLHTVTSRLRSTQGQLQQNEKMAALGTLSAGLAHELNNPAAAAKRSADQLKEVMVDWQRLTVELDIMACEPRQRDKLAELREEMSKGNFNSVIMDPLARSDLEGEVQTWLEDRNIDEAWDLAPALVTFGWDVQRLEGLTEHFTDGQLSVVLPWLSTGYSAYGLLNEVGQSATRISEIVKAVKTYSYLDQAPVQKIDVHEGLENTLIMLKHKLRNVTVHKEYDPNLPQIEAYGSELNQVWTNIMDNAIDAMGGQGDLTLRTYLQNERVVVEIEDNGPGIPADVQPRIFEPFYTTKGPGVGTGLGLHIAYNIVADKHRGEIAVVESRPGKTLFRVTLPQQLVREPS